MKISMEICVEITSIDAIFGYFDANNLHFYYFFKYFFKLSINARNIFIQRKFPHSNFPTPFKQTLFPTASRFIHHAFSANPPKSLRSQKGPKRDKTHGRSLLH